jgi:hypothetical protein
MMTYRDETSFRKYCHTRDDRAITQNGLVVQWKVIEQGPKDDAVNHSLEICDSRGPIVEDAESDNRFDILPG